MLTNGNVRSEFLPKLKSVVDTCPSFKALRICGRQESSPEFIAEAERVLGKAAALLTN